MIFSHVNQFLVKEKNKDEIKLGINSKFIEQRHRSTTTRPYSTMKIRITLSRVQLLDQQCHEFLDIFSDRLPVHDLSQPTAERT